jgi:hypothetical protein
LEFVTAWIVLVLTAGYAAPAGLEADDRHPTFAPAAGPSRHQALVKTELVDEVIMVQDEFSDIGSLLLEIASIEGPDRDHGTVDERQESFLNGLAGGPL